MGRDRGSQVLLPVLLVTLTSLTHIHTHRGGEGGGGTMENGQDTHTGGRGKGDKGGGRGG